MTPAMFAFALMAGSLWIILELSTTLIERMQVQELVLSLWLSELEKLFHRICSTPTTVLFGLGALTAMFAFWLATRPRALMPPCDLHHQSEEVEGGGHRSMLVDDPKLFTRYYEDTKTLYEAFQRGLHITGDGPCLGSRLPNQPYKWLSYREVTTRAEHLGSGLLSQGCQPNSKQFIGVFAQNRPEWIISELACYTYSMVVVPLYDTLGPDAIRYIINTAEISTVICDKPEKAKVLLDNVERQKTLTLKRVILMDLFDVELVEQGEKCGVHILALKDVEALGQEHYRKPMPPCSEDLSIICFTSGTTGNPKGVMLTHGNIVADFSGFLKATDKVISPNQEDVLISFLPLAHMFERLIEIFTQANTPVKRWLLNFAAKKKGEEVSSGIIRNNSIWDKIFFSKIQANLGGRLRMVITGAAPTSPTVLSFLRAALGCQVYEAYGQTECTAGCTFTTPGDWTSGHVGAPLPCNIIKLVDVPEKNYFTSKGEGEVCVKGPNVFKGYLKDPAMTAETLDSDGWLHTGDIGQWLPNGTLKIIDRKKHIFKLAQGEYISPEKIENIYIRSEPVSQLYVHGDSLQSCLVGIVVPDPEVMPSWAQKKGIDGCYDGLCKNVELKKAILDDMVCLGKAGGLHSFEQVKDIYIHNEMFSIENGLLTPTLKAKRPELKEYFKQQIEHLYDNITM
ncbi:long-chain-fatty-acid--CoA ligase 6 isoform X3 [Pangasianodon hypophthalmus]|uniref:long-chain-fatty-acid--CoA ligase 6 isoform X3 n=1 Tax=Pangasianodon hypophthalmus TaxID=310915 RepID=UPI0023076D89|nr:long-chain-fatty-acid--CoA ligase 6 isoform X3 [Pangasianodon hypophthalmus]